MKKILSLLILVTSLFGCSQSKKNYHKKDYTDLVTILSNDSVAYQQFIDLARCNCMDYLEEKKGNKTNIYSDLYISLNDLVYSFPRIVKNKEKLRSTLNLIQKERINQIVDTLKKQDEYFRDNRSSYLICYKAYKYTSRFSKELYLNILKTDLISDKDKEYIKNKVYQYKGYYNKNEY